MITDSTGIPLAATLTGGNRNDVTRLVLLLQAVPSVRGKRDRPRRRPDVVLAGYDHEVFRYEVREFQIAPPLARRGTGYGSGLGVYRRVVEGAITLPHWFRGLRMRGGPRRHPSRVRHPWPRRHLKRI
ncbi:hypothetical protein [Streptomyces sp. NPDC057494]|uniref:hypothetical protein n=1 Tax=Streptomyces sp. NPDC057494 TaxID=3346148 RepID=UPI0036A2D297